MRRLELVFGAIVTALAVFVAVEARGARVYSAYLGGAVSAPLANSTDEPKRERPVDAPVIDELKRPRDNDEIRRMLREGAPGTYVDELLLHRDSALARWPDRRSNPLRVSAAVAIRQVALEERARRGDRRARLARRDGGRAPSRSAFGFSPKRPRPS